MSDVAENKPDPTTNAPEGTETKPEETTAPAASNEGESKPEGDKSVTEAAADTAKDTATKTTDSVFSMFGGGPKKEKKEEEESQEAKDEPSGSSKAQKKDEEVSFFLSFFFFFRILMLLGFLYANIATPESSRGTSFLDAIYIFLQFFWFLSTISMLYMDCRCANLFSSTGGGSRIP